MTQTQTKSVPRFATPIIETHCHLDYLDGEQLQDTLAAATASGIERIVTIAVSADNLESVRAIARTHEQVWCTQGIHPHEADSWSEEIHLAVKLGCKDAKTVAIGEIGLDYHYDHADRKAQARCFEAQLNLAKELDLPVVVHTRDADEDTRAILANHSQHLARKGVIHSFTSSLELAEFCLTEGFLLGFNGIVTFRNADNVRSVVEATPADSIVLETDSPYLTPMPFRGRPNAPHYLPLIAEAVAEIKGMDIEPFLQLTRRTSHQLFF